MRASSATRRTAEKYERVARVTRLREGLEEGFQAAEDEVETELELRVEDRILQLW